MNQHCAQDRAAIIERVARLLAHARGTIAFAEVLSAGHEIHAYVIGQREIRFDCHVGVQQRRGAVPILRRGLRENDSRSVAGLA